MSEPKPNNNNENSLLSFEHIPASSTDAEERPHAPPVVQTVAEGNTLDIGAILKAKSLMTTALRSSLKPPIPKIPMASLQPR
jgi:hypothetical protein